MAAEIISVGTELLLGHVLNTDTAFISQRLAEMGIDVYNTSVVGDNPARLTGSLKQALNRTDIVILTGGLGPTVDDITIETVTNLTGKKGIRWIKNKVGTAPGLLINYKDKLIACLPGPPRELEPMFVNDMMPYLKKYAATGLILKSRIIKIRGLAESKVNEKVKDLLKLGPPITVGIYAKLGQVDLKIMAKAGNVMAANKAIHRIESGIRTRLKNYIFGYDDETLEEAAAKALVKKRLTVAVAESCTGGLVSNRLTNVSGSSAYFVMGAVAYSNKVKEDLLGVSRKSLTKYGAVSSNVALEMARGVRFLACADIGVGITGIAGPTGGTKTKPVGLVYIALATKRTKLVKELRFKGSREDIKFQASQAALDMIRTLCGHS